MTTYDQWKTRSPDEGLGRLTCSRCGGPDWQAMGGGHCEKCEDEIEAEFTAEQALLEFYQWEPWA